MKSSWRSDVLWHLELMRARLNPKSVESLKYYHDCWRRRQLGEPLTDKYEQKFADKYEQMRRRADLNRDRAFLKRLYKAWGPPGRASNIFADVALEIVRQNNVQSVSELKQKLKEKLKGTFNERTWREFKHDYLTGF